MFSTCRCWNNGYIYIFMLCVPCIQIKLSMMLVHSQQFYGYGNEYTNLLSFTFVNHNDYLLPIILMNIQQL